MALGEWGDLAKTLYPKWQEHFWKVRVDFHDISKQTRLLHSYDSISSNQEGELYASDLVLVAEGLMSVDAFETAY